MGLGGRNFQSELHAKLIYNKNDGQFTPAPKTGEGGFLMWL
jgi:hypothetical protein